jgi:iron complex transport system substrate-binding protein
MKNLANTTRRQLLQSSAGLACAALLPASAWAAAPSTPKKRIVSIGGALTEIIYALGAQGELVATDTTSTYPAEASRLPSVGYARTLSSEGILALAPTHIVATEDAGPPSVIAQLKKSGIPLAVLAGGHRFEGVIERTLALGKILGKENAAQILAAQIQQDWQLARAPIVARGKAAPKLLFVLSHSPSQIVVSGTGSAAEAMMHYAGAQNAVQGFSGFKPLNPEALIAAQPDVIVFTDQGLQAIGGMAGALRLPGIAQTTAGQKRRMIALEANFFLGFGPRIAQALGDFDAAIQQALSKA